MRASLPSIILTAKKPRSRLSILSPPATQPSPAQSFPPSLHPQTPPTDPLRMKHGAHPQHRLRIRLIPD